MSDALFRSLRFLRHEFARALEHVDLRLEGFSDLEDDARELAVEVAHALLEHVEYTRGFVLDGVASLGRWELELRELPAPGGSRTAAAFVLSPAPGVGRALGLPPRQKLLFDGAYAYLEAGDEVRLWLEVTEDGARPPSKGRLPIVG